MRALIHSIITATLCTLGGIASGAEPAVPSSPTAPWMTLTATASAEAQADRLSVRLRATRDGRDAAAVQAGLQQAVAAALQRTAGEVKPGKIEVRSGNFSLAPRYGQQGAISGWSGTADVVIEGSDLAAVASLAGRTTELTVASVGFGLSPARRAEAEARASADAIGQFRAQAQVSAQAFGFMTYALHDVEVNANVESPGAVSAFRERVAKVADEPLPVQAGHATVTVTVHGTVELRP